MMDATIVLPEVGCFRETETAIFAARTNLPFWIFKLGKFGMHTTIAESIHTTPNYI